MHVSEQLARAFASMGRLLTEFQGDLSRPDFSVLVHLSHQATAGSPSAPATWPGRRGWTPRR
ncbi:hypothetical protein BJF81_12830 [Ornithinimicrobium sp. CNJ-824]|uniref:hypothetical protein n=1 Tax=Ornithinimicrobium sp. CNJ-824 TaxID=1904966 RepID=UPI00095E2338|nr:hypothetical protein [Ornithinimicrobium sp. CNJ-824]OLT22776.1 hypothetical protein BJF81_12830 [Ornithinimicrobium sp. CNJ-824]